MANYSAALMVTQVDWTIRLIVVNSKLSGADSFQGTVEYCFGHAGLIAISVRAFFSSHFFLHFLLPHLPPLPFPLLSLSSSPPDEVIVIVHGR